MRLVHAHPLVRWIVCLAVGLMPAASASAANRLKFPPLTLPAGAQGQRVHVQCEHDIVLTAYSLVIGYPPALVQVGEASVLDTSAEGADFVAIVRREGAVVYNVVLDTGLPFSEYLSPAVDHTLARLTVNLLPSAVAGSTADLVFQNGFDDGHHVYDNILTDEDGASVSPSRGTAPDSGRITVVAQGVPVSPNANAGPDVTAAEGTDVRLDAGDSQSPTGETLSYAWTQVSGPEADLSGVDTTKASLVVTLPTVGSDVKATFRVTVTAAPSGRQDTDDVSVSIVDMASRPVDCSAPETTQGVIDGGSRVVLFQGKIAWPSTAEGANWNLVRFTASGLGSEAYLLSNLRLYADKNRNNQFDNDDEALGEPVAGILDNGTAEFRFLREIPSGSSVTYFLVANVVGGAAVPGSLAAPLVAALGAALLGAALGKRRRRGLIVPLGGWLLITGLFLTSCSSDDDPVPTIREVQFGILDASDVSVQGARTGVFPVPDGLPLVGPVIEV